MKALLLTLTAKQAQELIKNRTMEGFDFTIPKRKYQGWVYLYCSKAKSKSEEIHLIDYTGDTKVNGKVFGRYWHDEIHDREKIVVVVNGKSTDPVFVRARYLQIFPRPVELSEYLRPFLLLPLTKAPKNYCYIEVEE